MKNEFTWRYPLISSLIAILPILIFFKLLDFQLDPKMRQDFREQGQYLSGEYRLINPPRGLIYDRYGNLLAGNQIVYEVGVELNQVRNPRAIALSTSLVLGKDYVSLLGLASLKPSPTLVHMTLADNATQEQVDKLLAMKDEFEKQYGHLNSEAVPSLEGLVFTPHLSRIYPEHSLASNILGFVNQEGRGYFGVEENYDDWLAGKPQRVWWPYDPIQASLLPEVPEGTSLVLTIDRAIQASMEELIDQEVDANGASSGTIIVLDPKTGEILAMATTERIDLNQYWNYTDFFNKGIPFNRAVSATYEPGSVFKVLPMLAGLDSGAVTPETEFLDRGFIEIGGTVIRNWNGGAWGPQDMQGCMQHSLNVCLAWIGKRMGAATFYEYMQRFGIGHLTGVDLAGEAAGRLKLPGDSDWYEADLGTNSFGQGVSVTPLQLAAAISAAANDGKIMAPHIVRSMITKGYQQDIVPHVISVPISTETALTLTQMLARSLEIESSDALVEGYRVAGKTGTAEIPTPLGYTSNVTNASFAGWGPVDDPQFLVYLWLEKPQSSIWASEVAAPVFRKAVERLVVLMGIPPDDIRKHLIADKP